MKEEQKQHMLPLEKIILPIDLIFYDELKKTTLNYIKLLTGKRWTAFNQGIHYWIKKVPLIKIAERSSWHVRIQRKTDNTGNDCLIRLFYKRSVYFEYSKLDEIYETMYCKL